LEPLYHNRKKKTRTVSSKISSTGVYPVSQIYNIPDDFVLVIDTREQRPLFTPPPERLTITHKALQHGDYSIYGFENKVAIERKKMSDLMSYIGSERERTVKKLNAMSDLCFKALVVEENWDDLFLPKAYSRLSSDTIRQALVSFQLRFGLHIFCHPYRKVCEQWVLDRLLYFHKQQHIV
jgi:ERCC4-type nuclease